MLALIPAALIGAALAVRTWLVNVYRVPSASMAPTLQIGDNVLAWKGPLAAPLARGTIIAFAYPKDRSVTYLKRVIGLPGDEIAFDGDWPVITGVAIQHGEPVPDTIVGEDCKRYPVSRVVESIGPRAWTIALAPQQGTLANAQKVVVPPGMLYVAGDNRDHSLDSRAWGFVPAADVLGTIDRIWFSGDPCAPGLRWDRVGPVR